VPVAEAVARLERATRTENHVFWSCDLSLLDRAVPLAAVVGARAEHLVEI
jgi:hypothetical protein